MNIPVLETERLRLRGHTPQDFEPCAAMWGDPAVVEHIGAIPFARSDSWRKILMYRGLWSLFGYGYWVLEEKTTGRYLGDVGFADFHRDIEPSLGDTPESGWVLAPHAFGKGFATEAMQVAHAWGEAERHWKKTVCIISPQNIGSLRVAEKLGYKEVTRTLWRNAPTVVLERQS